MAPLVRQLTYRAMAGMAVISFIAAFAVNFLSVQEEFCALPIAQPALSDFCGMLGIGNRPRRDERLAWTSRRSANCEDLRAHIERFPEGVYRDDAADLLEAKRQRLKESWALSERRLDLFLGQDGKPSADEAAAKRDALSRAQSKAERLCRNFSVTTNFRFRSARPEAENWSCDTIRGGVICGFEGQAVCKLDERQVAKFEICGA